jgi:hypothetical protein
MKKFEANFNPKIRNQVTNIIIGTEAPKQKSQKFHENFNLGAKVNK